VTVRGVRWLHVLVAATVTHVFANTLLAIVLLLPGAVPVRDALALPILLVVGTAVTARWAARGVPVPAASTHGTLVGGCVGVIALAYGTSAALLTGLLTMITGWLLTAGPAAGERATPGPGRPVPPAGAAGSPRAPAPPLRPAGCRPGRARHR
jgi:hypothetical protein